jgi:hypothetical protein
MTIHLKRRSHHLHLRHAWVTAGQPGEPVQLQCKECCKVKALHDPARFAEQVRAAAGRYTGQYL